MIVKPFRGLRPLLEKMARNYYPRVNAANRSGLACLLLAVSLPSGMGCASARPRVQPNIVVIVSDDLGYSAIGYNGYEKAKTPHIDSIIEGGVYFTNGYVSSPSCAPSRAGLLTGRYQARYGYESQTGSIDRMSELDIGVPTDELLLPELLKQQGYTTGVIGKWHLGYNEKFRPNERGVDYFFGFLSKRRYYWEEVIRSPIFRNTEEVTGKGYMTEVLAREAVQFIDSNKDKPFFLYFAPSNVHTPYVVPDEYVPPGGQIIDGMIQALDESVGEILNALKNSGVDRQTLIVFVNDNGGASLNEPFRGVKKTLYEGGIRVPFAINWPGRIDAGTRYEAPVIQLDVMPTVVAAIGGTLPADREYDGVDLMPFLSGERAGLPHDALYWRLLEMDGPLLGRAARSGELKLVVSPTSEPSAERVELFDLSRDPGEQRDLSLARPEETRRLREMLESWERRVEATASRR